MFPLSFLTDLIRDIRFQSLVGLFLLAGWFWRRPRPKRQARNKTVFITGCDSGVGHRIAKRCDEMGMHVFAGCLHPTGKGALELKEMCSDRLHVVPLDITNDEQVRGAVAYVEANLPTGQKGLYCLVNNAAVFSFADFELMTVKMCEEVININLMGTIRVTKHFLPLICRTQGRIVTITSVLARVVFPSMAVYAATKYGLNGFFSALRYELQEKGVHVVKVEPGDFSTTTDIMQWSRRNQDEIWKNMSPEDRKSKLHLFEKIKKKVEETKCSKVEQERNYSHIIHDFEDAMLAEEPRWCYVIAPLTFRIKLWLFRCLPEEWTFSLRAGKALSK